ncbi:MAG TPA: chemotaxis protein CheW [Steroidobacteraceae bacterium]|nr:chemotaxis protein CheW [Steroidobacteraceae bacterium]
MVGSGDERRFLLCRIGSAIGALALEHVRETLRPLPVVPLAAVPDFVLGCTILRGRAVPVVDARRLAGQPASQPPTRFVSLKLDDRTAALAVDAVLDVRPLPTALLADVPALLRAADAELVSRIGTMDSALLLVLEAARLVPEDAFSAIERRGGAA